MQKRRAKGCTNR